MNSPALAFTTASNDYVSVAAHASHNDLAAGTFAFWAYPQNLTSVRAFFNKTGTENMFFRLSGTTGNIQFARTASGSNQNYVTNDTPLAITNRWYFVCAVYRGIGTAASVIVGTADGDPRESTYGTASAGSGSGANAGTLYIGNDFSLGDDFTGKLACAFMWNRALPWPQILQAYRVTRDGWHARAAARRLPRGLFLAADLGRGSGLQTDYSGVNNHGTLTNCAMTPGRPVRRSPRPTGSVATSPPASTQPPRSAHQFRTRRAA